MRGVVPGSPLHCLQQDAVCQVRSLHIAWTAAALTATRHCMPEGPFAGCCLQQCGAYTRWAQYKLPGLLCHSCSTMP